MNDNITTLEDLNNFCLLLQQQLILIFTEFIADDKISLKSESVNKNDIITKIKDYTWLQVLDKTKLEKLLLFCNNCSTTKTESAPALPPPAEPGKLPTSSFTLPPRKVDGLKLTSKKSKEYKKNVISKRITKKSPRKQKNRT
jgi:hypothetical protein